MDSQPVTNVINNFTKLFGRKSNETEADHNNLDNIVIKTNVNEDLEAGDNSGMLNKIKINIGNSIEVEKSYKTFFIVLAVGLGMLALSLIFLPFVVIQPQKFLSLFSIGSFLVLASFIFIHGTTEYFKKLFDSSRRIFTIAYLISLILGFYYAFVKGYFLISLICTIVQLITLIIFTLSFIPGGRSGITMILSMLQSPVLNMVGKITGSNAQ